MNFCTVAIEAIFTSLPNLEKLTIHTGDELINFDSILTGVPSLRSPGILSASEVRNYNLAEHRTRPGLNFLTSKQALNRISCLKLKIR